MLWASLCGSPIGKHCRSRHSDQNKIAAKTNASSPLDPQNRFGVPVLQQQSYHTRSNLASDLGTTAATSNINKISAPERWSGAKVTLITYFLMPWNVGTPKIALLVASLAFSCGCRSGASGSTAMSIVPASGSGSRQVFTASYAPADGPASIATARVLFNLNPDGRVGCYVYYDRASSSFLLVNDSGNGTKRIAPGAAGHIENGQCDLDGGASSIAETGSQLIVRIAVAFKPVFTGKKNVYMYSDDRAGASTGLKKTGTWTIP